MKKLMTFLVILLLAVGSIAVARSADAYKLANIMSFENTVIAYAYDFSNIKDKEVYKDDYYVADWAFSPINVNKTDWGVKGGTVMVFDRFKITGGFTIKLNDLVTFKPGFENRMEINPMSNMQATALSLLERFQFKGALEIGKMYSVAPMSQTNIAWTYNPTVTQGFDIASVQEKLYIENRLYFADNKLELDIDPGWFITYAAADWTALELELEFIFKAKGFEQWKVEVEKWRKARAPLQLGPVALGFHVEQQFNFQYNPENWKDTTPGHGKENNPGKNVAYEGCKGEEGVFDNMKTDTALEFVIDVLASQDKIGLTISIAERLKTTVPYSWNVEETKTFETSSIVGVSLWLDTMVFGLYLVIETVDYYNSYSPEAGGMDSAGVRENWWDQSSTVTIEGIEYDKHPHGLGTIGPNIYLGFNKDWLEWKLSWFGWTNFRAWDAEKANYSDFDDKGVAVTAKFSSDTYRAIVASWVNMVETYFRLKW